jgi:adenylosuccinate lyase
MSREDAYRLVQHNAHSAWNTDSGNFRTNLLTDPEVMAHLSEDELENCFDPKEHLKNLEQVFARLGLG